ncbi:hypothetical protein ScPMuIL_001064 [Solemya velum]
MNRNYKPEDDPFLCNCPSCRRFWQVAFQDKAHLLEKPGCRRSTLTATISPNNQVYKVGSRVLAYGKYPGTVKFVGAKNEDIIAPSLYVGVKLDDNLNVPDNGMLDGKWYFNSPRGHGIMVKCTDVMPMRSAEKRPPLTGNYMFPSYNEIKLRRRERNKHLSDRYAAAGVTSPAFSEPGYCPRLETRSASSLRSVRSWTPRPIVQHHITDPNDIVYKDLKRQQEQEMRKEEKKILEIIPPQVNEAERLRQHFSGKDNVDQLTNTLRKLQNAYEAGLALKKRRKPSSGSELARSER